MKNLMNKVLDSPLSKSEALQITEMQGSDLFDLFASANKIREKFKGNSVELCAIVNAKSGACSEDCSYCAQSKKSKADIPIYPLFKKETVIKEAQEAKAGGVKRFSIVTSGKKVNENELKDIASMIKEIKYLGLVPCASVGLLDRDELLFLKENGLDRYHNNLETSERFFPEICRTHAYQEKIKTIEDAQSVGLSVCSGGIFGMGETWEDRIDMAFALKELNVDAVPINFLNPIKGTPLENQAKLNPLEALKTISLYRFLLPSKEIRICGGRTQVLGEFNSMVFTAGADSLMTGNYLTTTGKSYSDDLKLIKDLGLKNQR